MLSSDDAEAAAQEPVLAPHIVERRETLSEIAARYRTTVLVIAQANELPDVNHIQAGQMLQIPLGTGFGALPSQIRVAPGDTLQRLATQFDSSTHQLIAANRHAIRGADEIRVGQLLQPPGKHTLPIAQTGPCEAPEEPTDRLTGSSNPDLIQRRNAAAQVWRAVSAQLDHQIETFGPEASRCWMPALDAMRELDKLTQGLTAVDAAGVVRAALPGMVSYDHLFAERLGFNSLGPQAVQTMVQVLDRVADSPEGDTTIQAIARMDQWDQGAVTRAIAHGASPAYAFAVASQPGMDAARIMESAYDGMAFLGETTVEDTRRYAHHMEELGWLVGNLGGLMTPEQLDLAIDAYTAEKGPGWKVQADRLKAALADDGAALLRQAGEFAALPAGLAQVNDHARARVEAVLLNPLSQPAITTALRSRPEVAMGRHWSALMDFFSDAQYVSTAKVTDQMRKLSNEFATAYVMRTLIRELRDFDPGDRGSIKRAVIAFESLKESRLATWLGVPKPHLDKAVSALQSMASHPGGTSTAVKQQLAELDGTLRKFKGFDKSTAAGRLIRCAGISLASVGFLASIDRARSDASAKNIFKLMVDAAGMSQKNIELAIAWGTLDGSSPLAKLGGSKVGKVLGVLTVVYDLWNATEAIESGKYGQGSLYGLGAAGGLMAAYGAGIAGPLGFLLVGGSVVGLGLLGEAERATRHEPANDGGASMRFLESAGLTPNAARTLADQSPNGHSVAPLLAQYAQLHGLALEEKDAQAKFVHWINALSSQQLASVRDSLHEAAEQDPAGEHILPSETPDWARRLSMTLAESHAPALEIY